MRSPALQAEDVQMQVAIIGAGIAGVACARVLDGAGHEVVVLDRGHAAGGRLASRNVAGRTVDLGASYLTARDPAFLAVVEDWVARGVARAWTDTFRIGSPTGLGERKQGPVRYGAARGLRSLVDDLAAGLDVRQQVEVQRVGPGPTVDGTAYDAVVLAMPDPQALRLLSPELAAERAALEDRAWQPVLALAAGWSRRAWDLDGVFVHDSDVLDWVADDGARRGDAAPVLVAHSTAAFATPRLSDPDAAGPVLLTAVRRLLDLPEPAWSLVQRWTYAKPVGDRAAAYLLGGAGIGLCGDGWGAAKVEGAWLSGTALGQALLSGAGQTRPS